MRCMKQLLKCLILASLVFAAVACSKDEGVLREPHTQYYDGYSVTTFYTRLRWEVDTPRNFEVKIIGDRTSTILTLKTSCEFTDEYMKVSITVPSTISIPDDDYVLTSKHFLSQIAKRYLVEFSGGQVTKIDELDDEIEEEGFGQYLDGKGTESEPFEIASSTNFNDFLNHLNVDETKGKGLYFKQTESFYWTSGVMESNRTLGNMSFAGSYDGDGHYIANLNYVGSGNGTTDSKRGIFKSLENGAVIKNLYLKNVSFMNTASEVGVVAGTVSKTVVLENVAITGSLQGQSSVGGFIGSVTASAVLTLKNCKTNLVVQSSSGDAVGGAVGKLQDAQLIVSGFHTVSTNSIENFGGSDYQEEVCADIFQVQANGNYVGGLVGHVLNSSFEISGVRLLHAPNKYNDDVRIVHGQSKIGGLIGYIESLSAASTIKDGELALVISSNNDSYVGGYVGHAELSQHLTLNNVSISAPIKSKTYVGGGLGYAKLSGSGKITLDGFVFGSNEIVETPYYCEAEKYVGGFVGKIEGAGSETSIISVNNLSVAANVTSPYNKEDYGWVGGFAGNAYKVGIVWTNSCVGTGGIYIKGPFKVGGLIGLLEEGIFDADNSYDLKRTTPTIPAASSLKKTFDGHVSPYDSKEGTRYIGGAIGHVIKSHVNGIHVDGYVTGNGNYTGGVIGFVSFDNDLVVDDCSFAGTLTAANYAGGVVGEIEKRGKVQECINYGTVTGADNFGGIVGHMQYSSAEPYVNYCVNLGNVTGCNFVGGVVGGMSGNDDTDWCKIHHSANYGAVTANSNDSSPYPAVGGILGKGHDRRCTVQYCVNFGTITGSGTNICVGGIAGKMGSANGYVESNVSMRDSANYGEVSSLTSDSYVGGILGYLEKANMGNQSNSIIQNCYNAGSIPCSLDNDPGGIVGCAAYHSLTDKCINYGYVPYGNGIMGTQDGSADYSNCYTLADSYDTSKDLWPKSVHVFSTEQMGDSDYWDGTSLDFTNTWVICNGRPELRDCPFQYSSAPK